MLWEIVIGGLVVLVVLLVLWLVVRLSRRRASNVSVDVYRLLVAWRAAQCKAEIRAATSMVRRQLWAELREIEQRERDGR